jgi:hypothetical protein
LVGDAPSTECEHSGDLRLKAWHPQVHLGDVPEHVAPELRRPIQVGAVQNHHHAEISSSAETGRPCGHVRMLRTPRFLNARSRSTPDHGLTHRTVMFGRGGHGSAQGREAAGVFDVVFRDEVESFVIRLAEADERITAAAVVGSRAHTEGDRWSDIDLTFAVADAVEPVGVLDEWAAILRAQFDGTALFDLAAGPATYRVFLLPGALQVDLSVTPTSRFVPRGTRSDCCSERRTTPSPWARATARRRSAMPFTTRSGRGYASSGGAPFKRSTGSAVSAT